MTSLSAPSLRRGVIASIGLWALPLCLWACNRSPAPGSTAEGDSQRIRIARNGVVPPSGSSATATPAQSTAAPPAQADEAARYARDIRPIFVRRGCAGGSCHSAFRGGGFYFTGNDERELPNVTARIDRKAPEQSELLLKATGVSQHNGGRNIAVGSCDYRRVLAWIEGKPDVQCSDDTPRDVQRFAREVIPALRALGCGDCHSQPGPATQRLDLSLLKQPADAAAPLVTPQVQTLFTQISNMPQYPISPWVNPLLAAVLASDGKHTKVFDRRSCGLRRVYGYIAEAPELSCDVNTTGAMPGMPDFDVYVKQVYPALSKRACFDTTCHGGGVPEMMLRGASEDHGLGGWHDYLMLTARIEDFKKPDKSTFLTTIRNEQPHGGGQRLGGAGDCVDDITTAWLHKQPIRPCGKPVPPSYERFVAEVQPVLDKMTCTQNRCHGASLPHYVIRPFAKDAKTLRENYEWTLRKIDIEYMPFSEIMLRMREPCAYRRVGAWIENKPAITCEIITPPPSAFPKLADNPQHEKMKPGAPPPMRKG